MQQCIRIFISYLYEAQHVPDVTTAHHQKPTTALAASGFVYVEGCWTCSCWTLTAIAKKMDTWCYHLPKAASLDVT